MNLHQEWMTNNELFGDNYEKNLQIQLAKERFDLQRYKSNEGKIAKIDGVEERVVVQNHKNPMNTEKEDRYLHCALESLIHRGSVVEIENEIYLVVTDIDTNNAYKSCMIEKTNNILTIQTGSTETIKGYDSMGRPIIESTPTYDDFPCIELSSLSVNRRSDLNENTNLPFGRSIVTIPLTDKVKINMEYTMNGQDYIIIDASYSRTGLIDFMADKKV